MPIIPAKLASLMEEKVDAKMSPLGARPLAQDNPAYFKQMMNALGVATATATSGVLQFTPTATPIPIPPDSGPFTDTGLLFDDKAFAEKLYTKLRDAALPMGSTHGPYPPGPKDSGRFLLAQCEGLGAAIKEHYKDATLLSLKTASAPAKIPAGNFYGIVPSAIVGLAMGLAPTLQGPFFPQYVLIYAATYAEIIHTKTTSLNSSSCAVSGTVS